MACLGGARAQFSAHSTEGDPWEWIVGPWAVLVAVFVSSLLLPQELKRLIVNSLWKAVLAYLALNAGLFIAMILLRAVFGAGNHALIAVGVAWLAATFFCGLLILVLQAMLVAYAALSQGPAWLSLKRRVVSRFNRVT